MHPRIGTDAMHTRIETEAYAHKNRDLRPISPDEPRAAHMPRTNPIPLHQKTTTESVYCVLRFSGTDRGVVALVCKVLKETDDEDDDYMSL